ncbi:MAG: low affinity iron permease family protein [Bdellovibrionaceae bacterium]|nr:low affinity iron permease family protein [Bdellovibrio sp.]
MQEHFRKISHWVSNWVGTPTAFAVSVLGIVLWAFVGPYFKFSDTWQLVINTTTTIITFLIVFLIQNTQNRDARALHLKLDELIFATVDARNEFIETENLTDAELEKLRAKFINIQKVAVEKIEKIEQHKANRRHRNR